MNFHRIFLLSLILLAQQAIHAQSACDLFDHDGDGVIGANTWVYVLGQYDTAGEMDVDGTGWVDVRDLLAFIPYSGGQCPAEWYETSTGHIEELILTEWEVHETELAGVSGNLPVGSITYRLYAKMSNEEDHVLAVFGDDQDPLHIETDGTFYGFGGGNVGTVVVDEYNPAFSAIFPAYAYTTMLSCGAIPGENSNGIMTSHISNWQSPLEDLNATGDIALSDTTGGAWFNTGLQIPLQQDGLVFLGQFTVVDGSMLSGALNILAKTISANGETIETAAGLPFSSDNLDVLGCTDVEASNYNPAATLSFGLCLLPGDFDEDGAFTVADLLVLLDVFGCESCPDEDLNDDGVVSIGDLLIWLAFY